MKKYLVLVLALLCGLTASGCSFETEGVNGGFIRETYTGIIEEQFTENGNEYIRVDTENNEVIDFLLTDTTEINGDENISVGDSVEIDCVHRYETSTYEILKDELRDVLKTLTKREEEVLELRFGLLDGSCHTLEEVGKKFGVTRERIRQIEAKALRKLRHPSRAKRLKDFLID